MFVCVASCHSSPTDSQYVPALGVHVNLVCQCASHGRPQWHFDRLEKHYWAARGPPTRTGQMH